ncbi:MAG: DHH family phosphoesterase [Spirochaetales bacterium]|nr:MAG: DHH family phosphoesterase [Spirochaetales bacterium]
MKLNDITRYIQDNNSFILTTHESPDGDGLGAEYALCETLIEMGKEVEILNSDPLGPRYEFLNKGNLIQHITSETVYPDNLSERTLFILDTDITNTGTRTACLLEKCSKVLVIDHHTPEKNRPMEGWLNPQASSTCEMIFQIIQKLGRQISRNSAVALYTGIVYDTGSFIYPKTTARTFRIAEDLVNRGAVPNEIFTELYQKRSIGSLMLQSLVSSTLLLLMDNRCAVQVMPRETLIASRAEYDESQEIVNIPLQCGTVDVSVFFKEELNGTRHCSMRSKKLVDCAAIAHKFGGGGHKTAAGFRFRNSFPDIQEKVLEEVARYLT